MVGFKLELFLDNSNTYKRLYDHYRNNNNYKFYKNNGVMPDYIENEMAAATFIAAISSGYAFASACELAKERQWRESLSDRARNNELTDKEKEEWRESRIRTRDIIKKHWMENQPEKYLIHLLSRYNRHTISEEEKERLIPQITEAIDRIETDKRQDKLLETLQHPFVMRRIGRFNEETLNILANSVLVKVPDDGRDKLMSRMQIDTKMYANMSEEQKTHLLAQEMKRSGRYIQRTLSVNDIRANMPSLMRPQNERTS